MITAMSVDVTCVSVTVFYNGCDQRLFTFCAFVIIGGGGGGGGG